MTNLDQVFDANASYQKMEADRFDRIVGKVLQALLRKKCVLTLEQTDANAMNITLAKEGRRQEFEICGEYCSVDDGTSFDLTMKTPKAGLRSFLNFSDSDQVVANEIATYMENVLAEAPVVKKDVSLPTIRT